MFSRQVSRIIFGAAFTAALAMPCVTSAQGLFGAPPDDAATPSADTSAAPSAQAPKAAVKRKPRKPVAPKEASRVNVVNQRDATLVELSIVSQAARNAAPQVVAHDLASGKKVTAALAKRGGCVYSVSGTFDDQSTVEISAVDLCKDNNLNLVE
jgi:hypothetical protein